jgi:hypothetical protein
MAAEGPHSVSIFTRMRKILDKRDRDMLSDSPEKAVGSEHLPLRFSRSIPRGRRAPSPLRGKGGPSPLTSARARMNVIGVGIGIAIRIGS